MKEIGTMNAKSETTQHDWSHSTQCRRNRVTPPRLMTLTHMEEDFAPIKRTPQVKIMRRALGRSQEEFSAKFHIPLGTLRASRAGAQRAGRGGAGLSGG
jgi:putative transcriptional regulator